MSGYCSVIVGFIVGSEIAKGKLYLGHFLGHILGLGVFLRKFCSRIYSRVYKI
jgi:hypothetical protein